MFWFNKKNHIEDQMTASEKRERLFFHDLINQTHGLLLFLNLRQSQKRDIVSSEIEMLVGEVRTLQSLVKDHFHFKHKNLSSTHDWIPFSAAETSLTGLIHTYFPSNSVKTYIHLKGALSYDKSVEERENALIYFPVFYRIMNNLIKNMAEANSSEVHFYFDYGSNGLTIETRNKLNVQRNSAKISDKISRVVTGNKPTETGLGLESIYHLASECGGVFEFETANDMWINRISLPLPPVKKDLKKAA